jgi:hypothetical protein
MVCQVHREGLLMKRIWIVLVFLLVSLALWAHDHPWPPPIATFEISDIGSRTSPLAFSGTASLYVDRKPDNTVLSWVEGDHMKTTNVSNKVITKMVVEVRWQEAHGEGTSLIHYDIDLTDPPPDDSLLPGASRSVGGPHRPVPKVNHKSTDFDNLPVVKPQLRIHAVSVTFSDGSTYYEPSDDKERPW